MFSGVTNQTDDKSCQLSSTDWLVNKSYCVTIEDDGKKEIEEIKLSSESDLSLLNDGANSSQAQRDSHSRRSDKKRKKKSKRRSDSCEGRSSHRSESRRSRYKKSRGRSSSRSDKHRHHKAEHDNQRLESQKIHFKKVFREETGLPAEKAYRIDNQPDRNNLAFDTMYYLLVPKYDKKRSAKSHQLRKILSSKKKTIRYFNGKKVNTAEPLTHSSDNQDLSEITFAVTKSSRPTLDDFGRRLETIYDASSVAYIKGKALTTDSEVKVFKEDKDINLPNNDKEASKIEYFNRHLRENPHDISVWLQFLEYGDENFLWASTLASKKVQDLALNEKKLSIVDKAISLNPKCIAFKLKRLDILQSISSPDDLEKEWKKLAFVYPNDPKIWKCYFNFLQNSVTHFTVPKTIKVYNKCLNIFKSMLEGTFHTHKPPPNLQKECLNLIFNLTLFLSESGFIEKSIAIWQALIEFNLFPSENISTEISVVDLITLFEPFWDSGCPRFGEKNARGWDKMTQNQLISFENQTVTNIDELEDVVLVNEKNKAKIWYQIEDLRESHYWMPIKIHELDQTDDPERSVPFEDISQYLFRITEPSTKVELLETFIQFLAKLSDKPEKYVYQKLLNALNLNLVREYSNFNSFFDEVYRQSIILCLSKFPSHGESFVMKRLDYLIHSRHFEYKPSKKVIKDYLKLPEFRSSLQIWNLLVDLELEKGSQDQAESIYETAIEMFVGKVNSRVLLQFVIGYAELLLGIKSLKAIDISFKGKNFECKKQDDRILKAITNSVIGEKNDNLSSNFLLKIQRILTTMERSHDEYTFAIQECSILILLLSNNVLEALHRCSEILLVGESIPPENVFSLCLKVYCLKSIRFGGSLGEMRNVLQKAINNYPSNEDFLSLFLEVESKVAIPIAIHRYDHFSINSEPPSHIVLIADILPKFSKKIPPTLHYGCTSFIPKFGGFTFYKVNNSLLIADSIFVGSFIRGKPLLVGKRTK